MTQLTHLLRTMLCKFLSKATCTVMLEIPSAFPLHQQKHFCDIQVFFFFYGRKLCKLVIQHSLNEEKCCSGSRFFLFLCLKQHLEHSRKCTMPPTPPVYVCKIEHLWLPLTFAWMRALLRGVEQRWGLADSVPASLLIFSQSCLLFSSEHAMCYSTMPSTACWNIFCCILWS